MAGGPTTIVIFGGTDDLAQRKLLPALFHIWQRVCGVHGDDDD